MSISIVRSFSRLSITRGASIALNHYCNKNIRVLNINKSNMLYKQRFFSSEQEIDLNKFATYEQVKDLKNHPEKLLIDVREPNELAETGTIPTSINIPLNEVAEKLNITDDEFKKLFNRQKPRFDTEIIFHCKIGMRSQVAVDLCKQLGYTNVKNYKGSWIEWSEKENLNK